MLISLREYARRIKKSAPYVCKLVKQGVIQKTDGKIDFAAAEKARLAKRDPAGELRKRPEADGRGTPRPEGVRAPAPVAIPASAENTAEHEKADYYEARARREEYEARLKQLEYEKQIKALLPAEEVITAEQRVLANLRANLRGVSRKVAPRVSGKAAAECERIIRNAIDSELKRTAEFPFGQISQ
jgi:hypothetical protein